MIWRVLMVLWLNKFYAGRRGPVMVRDRSPLARAELFINSAVGKGNTNSG